MPFKSKIVLLSLILVMVTTITRAQKNMAVKGQVRSSTDNTVIGGVSVMLKTNSAYKTLGITDDQGIFHIQAPSDGQLEFRAVAFVTKAVQLRGRDSLNILMEPAEASLKDAIVVGYQKKTKETVTGAVTRITADDIKDVPVSNIEQLLQGKVAGLNIQQTTGAPGFRGSAAIRGLSQILVQGQGNDAYLSPQSPLYVIDGIPVDASGGYEYGAQSLGPGTSPLSLIPPEDIQTIDVMKDAEATALYGSKGANGVIVITTKRGNSEIPIIRYTGNLFYSFPPPLRNTVGGKAERDYRINMIEQTMDLSEIYKISLSQFLADSLNPFFNNSTNWQQIYYQTTDNQSHNLQVSGGNQKLNYKTNLNYYNEKGVIKNTGYNRYTLSMNINFNPSPRLQVAGYLSAGLGKKLKGSGNGLTEVGAGSSISSSLLPGPSYFINVGNFTDALYRDNNSRTYNARAYLNASYALIDNLRLSTNTSYDFTSDLEDTYTPALANNGQSTVYGYSGRKSALYNRSAITYNNTIHEKHNFYASLFTETEIDQGLNMIINRGNGPNDIYRGPLGYSSYFSGVSGIPQDGGYSVVHSVGLAGNIQYDYDKIYVLNLNYRQDGNSYSGEKGRWAKSPSLGFRWNFNKEAFLKEASWLDYGDVRFSYGINLRPTTNIFASQGWYDVNGNYNGVTRISPHLGLMPNPNLKPEKVKQFNYGLDLGIAKGRFGLTVDYYTKTVYDMIYSQDLSTATGFQNVYTNAASLYNYGYEVQLNFRPFPIKSKVNWTVSVNGAMDKNVLLSLPGGASQILSAGGTIVSRVGYEALLNFLYTTQGVYRTDNDVPVDPVTGLVFQTSNGSIYKAGDLKFKDVNGNYISDVSDLELAGTPVPRFTGGFSSYLTYKNFSLNFNGSFTLNRKLLNNALAERLNNLMSPFATGTLVNLEDLNYWKGPGDVARYPNPFNYLSGNGSFTAMQTLFQEDGSYIKLNALTLAYAFDKKLSKRYGLSSVRVYSTVTNLFMITSYSGPNPESVSELGRDGLGTYPIAKTLTFGINVEF